MREASTAGSEAEAAVARHCPDLDPATIRGVRAGNAIWPGLAFFAGISFVAYLLVKLMAGTVPPDAAFAGQMALAAVLTGLGGWQLARARYFFVVIEGEDGARRISGLSKAEQEALRTLAPAVGPAAGDAA